MEFKVPLNADDLEIESSSRLYVKTVHDMKSSGGTTALRSESRFMRTAQSLAILE